MAVPDAPVVARLAALLLLVLLQSSCSAAASGDRRTTYIVHMDSTLKPASHSTHEDWYAAQLQSLSADDDTQPRADLLYSYTTAFNGYAASLLPSHVPLLQTNPSVLHIYQDPVLHLHTTRSPEFLGLFRPGTPLTTTAATISAQAADVIVGVLDTGVWPESKSFDDTGMPPVPTRWHGECEAGVDFAPSLCNKKLIGARSFSKGFHAAGDGDPTKPPSNSTAKEYVSPRDRDGHGTHTASTAAGTPVTNASLFGYASGTARGMAPSARVAVYKVCWTSGCFGSDILAAMDRAIDDGVDVLSLSLGGGSSPYFRDTIAVGAFAAASRGVFVSCSAGNSGPRVGSLANTAPWIATVGAGTLDRDFPAYADLGDGVRRVGVSLYSGEGMGSKSAPLIYFPSSSTSGGIGREGRARVIGAGGLGTNSSNLCLPGSLDAAKVKGKVVLCDRGVNARVEKGAVVKSAGGVGMILANTAVNGEELVADSHLLPALAVGSKIGDRIREYARTAANPTALLSFGGTVLDVRPSPVVAAFSSRGPNGVVPQILKPDIIGPGVNILAGWSGSSGPTGLAADSRRTDFNIMSGTSMSCPHISGLAALLKAAHPDWSAAAIKSALMTTAYTVDNTGTPLRDASAGNVATPYAYGSGHVDPQKALNPGLVYDIATEDYISFLCSLRYTPEQIRVITSRSNVSCSHRFKDPGNLNYPSFSVLFDKKAAKRGVKYVRELTNVGAALSTYDVKVEGPANVTVAVKPVRLVFRQVGQKLRYTVTFMSKTEGDPRDAAFGWITWSNEQHRVRSPVAYRWSLF